MLTDGVIVAVIMNQTVLDLPIDFRLNGEMSVIESPSESIMTVLIRPFSCLLYTSEAVHEKVPGPRTGAIKQGKPGSH